MECHGAQNVGRADEVEKSETTIEIKIKTLDSQTYTLRVDKQMPVPALKEQIASVTGVVSEQQRLICRGRVLKDDQLLSAYHVEDGHTLHMVVRQPFVQSSEGLPNDSAFFPASTTDRSHGAPSVVIEAFSMPDRGDGVPPEISRIVSAVLGSFGFPNMGSGIERLEEHDQQRSAAATATLDSTLQPEQAGNRVQSDRSQSSFGLPTSVSLGSLHPPVMLDSLTTLSQYLRHLGREFSALVTDRGGENVTQADAPLPTEQRESNSASGSGTVQDNLPTPASLAEVMLSSRQFMHGQVSECLQQLARQLESQVNVTDPAARFTTQSTAWRTGVQLYNLGAFLLELGRTTMTLRLGQAPSEAVVNAGPAVFISPSAPNPLMVQPLPFQPGTSFGAIPVGSVQPGSGLVNGIGTGFLPRRIDIQIRRGSSTTSANPNRDERGNTPNPSAQTNNGTGPGGENLANQTASRSTEGLSFGGGESGVRVVPIRTMVAAVPGPFSRLPSDSSTNSMGLYYPVLGRFQHVPSGNVNGAGARGSEASAEHHPSGVQNVQQSTSESNVQQQNAETQIRDGSLPTSNSRQNGGRVRHRPDANTTTGSGTRGTSRIRINQRAQANSESERQSSILQLLRNLFPGGEIHVDDSGLQGATTGSSTENARTPAASVESQSGVTDEGIFLSNLLQEIMPLIIHQRVQESSTQAETSGTGASHRHNDNEPSEPDSKRQKDGWSFRKSSVPAELVSFSNCMTSLESRSRLNL
ncbi:Ubiquitin-like domain-containing protein CIP73 [Euphorbia peplus]|nr:Ubiquitin-like domain-containing protein CIP73 [Euphorbia peplus]